VDRSANIQPIKCQATQLIRERLKIDFSLSVKESSSCTRIYELLGNLDTCKEHLDKFSDNVIATKCNNEFPNLILQISF